MDDPPAYAPRWVPFSVRITPSHLVLQRIMLLHSTPKMHLYPILQQILLDGIVDLLCLFRAQVANGAVHQLQPGLNGALANGLYLVRILVDALHMGVCTELQIDLVRIIDGILRQVRTDQAGQIAAYLIAQGQLAVRKRARTGKAGGNVAGRAGSSCTSWFWS